jgi:hypothetical protein
VGDFAVSQRDQADILERSTSHLKGADGTLRRTLDKKFRELP